MKLNELLEKVSCCKKIIIIPRDKNEDFILRILKIRYEEVFTIIRELTEKDFVKKVKDRNPLFGGDLWIFKKVINNYVTYIKIKYIDKEDNKTIVISFHEDEK